MDEESLEQLISEIKRLSRLDALSLLCSYLSCSFNYPSIEQAKRYTSAQYIDLGATICAHAFIVARVLDRCQYAAKSAAQSAESAQASPEKTAANSAPDIYPAVRGKRLYRLRIGGAGGSSRTKKADNKLLRSAGIRPRRIHADRLG